MSEISQSKVDARSKKIDELETGLCDLIANLSELDFNELSDGITLEVFYDSLSQLTALLLGDYIHRLQEKKKKITSLACDYAWLLRKKIAMVHMLSRSISSEQLNELERLAFHSCINLQ